MKEISFSRFYEFACVTLAGLVGCLIAIPIASSMPGPSGTIVVVGFTAFGFLTGYRRRQSHAFLYFCLIAAVILSCLLALASAPQPSGV